MTVVYDSSNFSPAYRYVKDKLEPETAYLLHGQRERSKLGWEYRSEAKRRFCVNAMGAGSE